MARQSKCFCCTSCQTGRRTVLMQSEKKGCISDISASLCSKCKTQQFRVTKIGKSICTCRPPLLCTSQSCLGGDVTAWHLCSLFSLNLRDVSEEERAEDSSSASCVIVARWFAIRGYICRSGLLTSLQENIYHLLPMAFLQADFTRFPRAVCLFMLKN